MTLPYGGKCPYDNTVVDYTFGYSDSIWYCQNGHEWGNIEDIEVGDRCEGSFRYGTKLSEYTSMCVWCGQIVEHTPFFNRANGNKLVYHLRPQTSKAVLEPGDTLYFSEAKYFGVITDMCDGCQKQLDVLEIAQIVTDRFSKRQYVIHLGCWSKLVDILERGV